MNLGVVIILTFLGLILFFIFIFLISDLVFIAYFKNKLDYKKDFTKLKWEMKNGVAKWKR